MKKKQTRHLHLNLNIKESDQVFIKSSAIPVVTEKLAKPIPHLL